MTMRCVQQQPATKRVRAKSSDRRPGRLVADVERKPRFIEILEDPWYRMLVGIQSTISAATFEFFTSNGLEAVHLPLTTTCLSSPMGLGSDSLGVRVDLFGVPTYLADSMQFGLEYVCRLCKVGCFYLLPSFRGDLRDETHLCQFYHSEAEIIGNLDDCMRLAESYVAHVSKALLMEHRNELEGQIGSVAHVDRACSIGSGFARITFEEALAAVGPKHVTFHDTPNGSFRRLLRSGEKKLLDISGAPIWVLYPDHLSVPFYQAFTDSSRTKAKSADLLAGVGEMLGAGQRHDRIHDLDLALNSHAIDPVPYDWYRGLRVHRHLETSGFGMGIERFLCWVLGCQDIRSLELLPRINGEHCVP